MKAKELLKTEVRRLVKNKKKALSKEEIEQRSRHIISKIFGLDEYQNACRIYAYVSYNQEVSTFQFMRQVLAEGKTLLVPKVHKDVMRFHEISDLDELRPGAYGILEPDNEKLDTVSQGFMLLPGLAFDKEGHRLGYGGGFYDKYLNENPCHYKAALAYDFQVFEEIPFEAYDIPVDCLVTEADLYIF